MYKVLFCSVLSVFMVLMHSCNKYGRGDCELILSFSEEYNILSEELRTKGGVYIIPDTNDFILSISREEGEEIYKGAYGKKPSKLAVAEGIYILKVYSVDFKEPSFDMPQFGDSCSVSISSGGVAKVDFKCIQLNSGMKIRYSDDFKNKYASSSVVLRKGEKELEYSYTEDRIAYFNPGKVELRLVSGTMDKRILGRILNKSEILTINLSIAESEMGDADYHIVVDTGRVWITEKYEYGAENDGSSKGKAFSVEEAIEMVGEEDVWVKGYIVGGDMTSASICYSPPFTSATHLAIASHINQRERSLIMAVELKIGAIRDSLNLVNNQGNLHKFLYLKGNIVESYFGVRGVKGVKEFERE